MLFAFWGKLYSVKIILESAYHFNLRMCRCNTASFTDQMEPGAQSGSLKEREMLMPARRVS